MAMSLKSSPSLIPFISIASYANGKKFKQQYILYYNNNLNRSLIYVCL
ncbi:hypothetical protein NC653_009214 [Populus alba x Populus x berolinensis]|uniref:Uncharacterized protein n=1 Tax=Populus alba x Populus x berolinensis TaxID=444605 RepID=A0AAD6W9L7_9ROSI|nr:hypothetical protein NC653_009214 [Populus alba x Populus x berolinensis]